MRVSQARREVTFNQDVKAFVANGTVPADFLFWGMLALAPEIHSKVESSGHGTGKLPSDRLLSATLAVPGVDVLGELTGVLTQLNERIALSRRESSTLAATRDLLLPKLMSGEIRLAAVEAMVGAAT
jgi:type I restriction enzyme, S subunit